MRGEAARQGNRVHAAEGLWVFGYGSLMWRPGFRFVERVPARIAGLHRSLCVYSHVHRGTPERPGLVLGLDRGGSCRGILFRVDAAHHDETLAYLREREQATLVYREEWRRVRRLDGHPPVTALVYVVDRLHRQYAGALSREALLEHVRQGVGISGPNPDYVTQTVEEMERQGIRDATLHWLASRCS
ncbi:MAG: gamma-glutamylcyclotransferase [Hyphomicrobiaceae bacterium]|nr:gamma-glutamylcyclotransferase [Hyphomicrobiaceae bacterium]